MPKNHQNEKVHQPVLAQEVIEYLDPRGGESYLDLTAGYGGHAELISDLIGCKGRMTLVDRDEMAINTLKKRFEDAEVIHSAFLTACERLAGEGKQFDMILADLGVSSPHLDIPLRGFSFKLPGPLDMRMDQSQRVDAAAIVNSSSEEELARIIREYGEEPKAKAITRRIIENRPIKDTLTLATIVAQSYGPFARKKKIHPATKTFQALRVAVNDELGQLAKSLPLMESLLAPGGRLAIISFHSLEDRLVKQYFAENAGDRYDADLRLLTQRPLTASAHEISLNPRARSARLRAAAKIKT